MAIPTTLIGFIKSRITDFNPPSPLPGALPDRSENLVPCALFLQGILALSPVLPVLGIRGTAIYFVVYLITAYELIFNNKTLPLVSIYLCAAVFIGACLAGLHWNSPKTAFVSLFFIGSILITSIADRDAVNRFITISTYFFMVILALCWIGFFYTLHGGKGLFSISNYDGRENIFYLTTFSNYVVANTIRPSGIFDEPGALSFLVCALATLRVIYKRNILVSIVMLQLGTVVFGFTHYLFFIAFILFLNNKSLKFKAGLLLAIFAVNVIEYLFLKDAIDILFMWKFNYHPETKTISGDNRSSQVLLARSVLSLSTFLWGLDSTAIMDIIAFKKKFTGMSENPLGPLVTTGIFVSFPYYYILTSYFGKGICSKEHRIFLAVVLLFLPRPFITGYGYSVLAMLLFLSLDAQYLHKTYRPAPAPAPSAPHLFQK
jgi:hypothetical protein